MLNINANPEKLEYSAFVIQNILLYKIIHA